MKQVLMIIAGICLLFGFSVTVVQAHDMWLEKKGDIVELNFGHPGKTDPYPMERINSIKGYTKGKWAVPLEPLPVDGEAFAYVTDDYPLLTVNFDNWYWYHTEEEGWQQFRTPIEMKETIIEEGASYKLSKEIVEWTPYLSNPVGQRAEIVPLVDPTRLKEGDMLPIQVYFEGKVMPLEGSRTSLTTDQMIEHPELVFRKTTEPVKVKIGPPGRQIIIGKYAKPLGDKKFVWFAFSLTFTTSK